MKKKRSAWFMCIVVCCFALLWEAETKAASFGVHNGSVFLYGEMFTPQQDVSFSGITLNIHDYVDQVASYFPNATPQDSTVRLSLMYDVNDIFPSTPFFQPRSEIAGATATITANTGLLYDFDLSASLQAGTLYWLCISLSAPDPDQSAGVYAFWDGIRGIQNIQSDSPVDVMLNGFESGTGTFNSSSYQNIGQEVVIPVPEPGEISLGVLSLLIFAGGTLLKRSREPLSGRFQCRASK
jgi:hypothetical protein